MLNKRTWTALILLGFAGQLAWAVENQYLNTFMYDKITPDPRPIYWMVAASAITATLTSILMGALSDRARTPCLALSRRQDEVDKTRRWGRRHPFILLGYAAWAGFTAAFPTAAFFHPIALAVALAITFDCVVTFCGSSAIDASISLVGFGSLRPFKSWLLGGSHPSATNSFAAPDNVTAWEVDAGRMQAGHWAHRFPACSVVVVAME